MNFENSKNSDTNVPVMSLDDASSTTSTTDSTLTSVESYVLTVDDKIKTSDTEISSTSASCRSSNDDLNKFNQEEALLVDAVDIDAKIQNANIFCIDNDGLLLTELKRFQKASD